MSWDGLYVGQWLNCKFRELLMVTACYISLRNGLWGEVTFDIKIRTDVLFLLKQAGHWASAFNDRTFWPKTVPHCLPPSCSEMKGHFIIWFRKGWDFRLYNSFCFGIPFELYIVCVDLNLLTLWRLNICGRLKHTPGQMIINNYDLFF